MTSTSWYLCKVCLCILALAGNCLWAQDPHPTFKQYDVEDGLASSKVYQVKQDSKGYIWFATSNGVSRFNGYEFENFSMSDGLPDNTVFEIFEDQTGKIWFLPLSNMLSYYENGRIHQYKYNHLIRENIKTQPIKTSFYIDGKGTVFIGLYQHGICEISESGEFKFELTRDPSKNAILVLEPEPGHFIYADNNISNHSTVIEFKKNTISRKLDLHKSIRHIYASTSLIGLRGGSIAFGCINILYFINKDDTYKEIEFDHRIISLYEDKEGGLWVGTVLGGVYHIRNTDSDDKACYLQDLTVTSVLIDKEGGLWIATEGNSVYYSHSKDVLTNDKTSGFKDNMVSNLALGKRSLFAGIQMGFIHELDTMGKVIMTKQIESCQKYLVGLYYDVRMDKLWYSGVSDMGYMKNGVSKFFIRPGFYELLPIGTNDYFMAGSLGIAKFRNDPIYYFENSGLYKRANAILQKNENTLYIGSIDGLWEYNITNSTYNIVGKNDSLLRHRILHLVYAQDSALLIATKGAGLLVYEKGAVSRIGTDDGLSSDNVFKLLVEDSIVWAATDKGLSRIVRRKGKMIRESIRVFTTFDGLVSNEINTVLKFHNKIWVATDKGMSVFDPKVLTITSYQVPIYIHNISVNDSSRSIRSSYDLPYFENNIKIRFIALSYKNAGKQQYRYKMTGLNPGWNYTHEREIQYTTLPPGNYTFEVSVLNASGIWSKEVQVQFSISTPFWKTWWFILLSLAGFIYTVFLIMRFRLKKTQDQKNKNEEINRVLLSLKLKALRAQMNPHFIFNVMNSIQHFVLYKNNEAAHRYLSKFARLIRTILNNSDKNMIPLSEEIKALELYLDLEAMRFEKRFDYEIRIDGDLDTGRTEIPSMLIQPYVENAVKHGILDSATTGKIKIEIVKHGHFLKCSIEDNGVGMEASSENKSAEYRSFGTSITKERLLIINELYNNKLTENVINLYNDEGKASGTKVELFIPYNLNQAKS